MAKIDKEYHNILEKILREGYMYEDPNRKGVSRLEMPSYTFRHEFKDGFPAITTKKLHYRNVVTELIWFLRGDTNIKYLVDNGCNIWNKDAYNYYLKNLTLYAKVKGHYSFKEFIQIIKETSLNYLEYDFSTQSYTLGDLGPVYGKQWSDRNGINQIEDLIKNLKSKPLEARHYVDAWNPEEKHLQALPPCHYGFQIVVRPLSTLERVKIYQSSTINDNILSDAEFTISKFLDENNIAKYGFELHWNQMSCDTFLGIPYNIASYATLALILEKITGYKALAIQGDLKKVHLYDNSLNAVKEQLSRDVDKYSNIELTFHGESGTTMFDHFNDIHRPDIDLNRLINTFTSGTFKLMKYESYPAINVEMLSKNN